MAVGLSNGYLDNLGKKLIGRSFLGVFPCDLSPKTAKQKNYFTIFNLSKHNEEGTHFISVSVANNKAYYFDPLGDPLSNPYLIEFLYGKDTIDLKHKIQDDTSNFCGYFSLAFILCIHLGYTVSEFFNVFDNQNLLLNDTIVTELIVKSIN